MTQNPSLPDPHEWHWSKEKPCHMCGLTQYVGIQGYKSEHRLLRPGEPKNPLAIFAVRPRRGGRIRYLDGNGVRVKPAKPKRPRAAKLPKPKATLSAVRDPLAWHWSIENTCSLCGLGSFVGRRGRRYKHRQLHPGEQVGAHWAVSAAGPSTRIRYLSESGRFIDSALKQNTGNRTELRGKRGDRGPTVAVRDRIMRAATLLANGRTRPEVASLVKVSVEALYDYQFLYPGLWQQTYDAAMTVVRETVRQLAGTDSMPEDLNAFILAGVRAERWSRTKGESLFDRGDALTLPLFYERHYLPLRPASKETVYFDRIILRRWAILTGDPPLTELTAEHLVMYRDRLSKMRGIKSVGYMSPNTVSGYMKKLQTFLDKAGPPGPRNRDALGLVDKVPWVKPPRGLRRVVRIVSEETLNNFYLGCIAARRPRWPDIKPAAWWRALVVLAYNTGLRCGTLFSIRMSWINWERRCIAIPPQFTKTGQEQIMPMNPVVFEHLNAIRGEREYLFRFTKGVDQTRRFYVHFHKVQDACGIPREQHFGLHQLRKTCATVLWEHNPQVAQFALGHSSMETTATFYVRGQAMLERAVQQMPQPNAFVVGASANGKDGAA